MSKKRNKRNTKKFRKKLRMRQPKKSISMDTLKLNDLKTIDELVFQYKLDKKFYEKMPQQEMNKS